MDSPLAVSDEVPAPAASCPPDPGRPDLPQSTVSIGGVALEVEVARTHEHQARGLMYRTELADDAGMLFVFERAEVRSFWMRNTCVPLDMLFLDADGVVVGVLENVPTLNDESRAVRCPSVYVLEVNAGWARRHGVTTGIRAELGIGG